MEYKIPYSYFYHPNFIDPLYAQYLTPRQPLLNSYLLNKNEFRNGCEGLSFRKNYSDSPCPPGYSCYNIDYCKKDYYSQIGLYNCPFEHEYQVNNQLNINFYKNGLQRKRL